MNNLSEIESAKRAWFFSEYSADQYFNEAGLSPFQYFILSRYESEEDVEGLRALDFYNEADLDGRFRKYVKRLTAILGNTPSIAAEKPALADKRLAAPWDEDKCRSLSHQIVKELELESPGKFPAIDLELKFGSKPCVRERWARIFSRPKLRQSPELTPIVGDGPLRNDYHGSSFIRIGYLFFLSESDYLRLSEPLKMALGGNAILIKELYDSTIDHIGLGPYTMTAIVAMLNSDLSGKRVMDFGAADGILSLVALKLGASSVILIDIDGKELNKANDNLELNGFKYNDDYYKIVANLKDKEKIAQALRGLPLSRDEIAIVSNIGSSEHWYYGTTNLISASLIPIVEKELYSKVTTFIAGGVLDEETNAKALIKERSFLKQLGFEINSTVALYGFFKSNSAWIADRKNKLSKQKEVINAAKAHQNNI
jgi:predicted nicotinamide N-methyase